jgi:hypothetical protein
MKHITDAPASVASLLLFAATTVSITIPVRFNNHADIVCCYPFLRVQLPTCSLFARSMFIERLVKSVAFLFPGYLLAQ